MIENNLIGIGLVALATLGWVINIEFRLQKVQKKSII